MLPVHVARIITIHVVYLWTDKKSSPGVSSLVRGPYLVDGRLQTLCAVAGLSLLQLHSGEIPLILMCPISRFLLTHFFLF